ncbi:MAG: hypothetical protein II551_01915 [Paludibacteraceae bacterium]|nr:hypothetical protein [Paludibacteraceae bacterium]
MKRNTTTFIFGQARMAGSSYLPVKNMGITGSSSDHNPRAAQRRILWGHH